MSGENDIRAVIDGIADSFSALDVQRWLGFFYPQHTFIHQATVFVAQSREATREAFAPMIEALRDSGFRRSILDDCEITLLSDDLANASTQWRRLGENDVLLEEFGATYTLLKTDEGWRVVVATVHDKDVFLVARE